MERPIKFYVEKRVDFVIQKHLVNPLLFINAAVSLNHNTFSFMSTHIHVVVVNGSLESRPISILISRPGFKAR